MKKTALFLAALFLFSVLQPCMAQSSNNDNSENAGYIVRLKNNGKGVFLLSESKKLRVISEKAGLVHADSLSDVALLGNSVDYYARDCKVTLLSSPNDKYAAGQWSIASSDISYAWDSGFNGKGVRIGLIDSGVNEQHEDLKGASFANGYNVIDGSYDVTDNVGHGTFVCGILSARRDNNLGIAGFCTDATIVPIKCFGSSLETDASYVIEAIYEAADNYHCDIINLSLGIKDDTQNEGAISSLEEAIEYATGKGIIVVSAVGNDGTSTLYYPAAFKCAIGVGSIDKNGKVADFSQKNSSVYVVSPGIDIIGLGNKTSSSYEIGDGTSFSTPFVTAAAAILKQFAPEATYYDFATLLRDSVTDEGPSGYDTSYGYGSLNYENFIRAMVKYNFNDIGEAYTDISGHWAEQYVRYCVNAKLFNGVTDSTFAPEVSMTRAMFITVLSRMSGDNLSGYTNPFSDVDSGAWYEKACAWGYAKGLVTGTGGNSFNPGENITRQEISALLYRYAKVFHLSDGDYDVSNLIAFSDSGQIAIWAEPAMSWAKENELINGRNDYSVGPSDSAKRCEVAVMLTRFINTFNVS